MRIKYLKCIWEASLFVANLAEGCWLYIDFFPLCFAFLGHVVCGPDRDPYVSSILHCWILIPHCFFTAYVAKDCILDP